MPDSLALPERRADVRFIVVTVGLALALFLAMLVCLELGRQFGAAAMARYGEASRAGVGSVDGAVYGLLALLMGFTFSGAATRFSTRQDLIVHETAAVETAWDRIDALPAHAQPPVREAVRQYVDAVIASHVEIPESRRETTASARVTRARHELWTTATAACLAADAEKARMLVLPALSEMFAGTEREHLSRRVHPPTIIFVLIIVMALVSALFAGYDMSSAAPNRFHMIGVAATIATAAYIILELEFPHRGVIRIRRIHHALTRLRSTM